MKSYSDTFKYNKIINIKCIGDYNRIILNNSEKVKDLIIAMNSQI